MKLKLDYLSFAIRYLVLLVGAALLPAPSMASGGDANPQMVRGGSTAKYDCCSPAALDRASGNGDANEKYYESREIQEPLSSGSEAGCDPARFYQASFLIGSCKEYMAKARSLHQRMQEDLLIAETLKGQANMNLNAIPSGSQVQLKGKALEDAKRQYSSNLQAFAQHAQAYQAALNRFQHDIGECHASQQAYEQQRQLYTLHCNQFHVPNLGDLPPPHICGALNMAEGDASRISGQIRADEQNLQIAVETARQRNAILGEGSRLAQTNILNTVKQSIRDQEEEKLSGQFGRLKEEYELLGIQSKVLSPAVRKQVGATVRTTNVSAKIAR